MLTQPSCSPRVGSALGPQTPGGICLDLIFPSISLALPRTQGASPSPPHRCDGLQTPSSSVPTMDTQ